MGLDSARIKVKKKKKLSPVYKQLKIWYKCDVFIASKLHELSFLVLIENPDIVCFSEVKPKKL